VERNCTNGSELPVDWFAELLRLLGGHVHRTHGGYTAQCPAHPDASPSLSLGTGREGQLLAKCFSGCRITAVLEAVNCSTTHLVMVSPLTAAQHAATVTPAPVFPPVKATPGGAGGRLDLTAWTVHAEHPYGDKWVLARLRHNVTGEKTQRWLTRAGDRWVPGRLDVPAGGLPAYRAQEVTAAAGPVLVVESESSADTAWTMGLPATTWPGGAQDARNYRDALRAVTWGRDVIVCPDNDPPGRRAVVTLRKALTGYAASIRTVDPRDVLTDCPEHADARDVLEVFGPAPFLTGHPPTTIHAHEPATTTDAAQLRCDVCGAEGARRHLNATTCRDHAPTHTNPAATAPTPAPAPVTDAACEACGRVPMSGHLNTDLECGTCADACACGHTTSAHPDTGARACVACDCPAYTQTHLGTPSTYTRALLEHRGITGRNTA